MASYNRLIHEKSPYLLQHQHNPVHWYAWGSDAFEAAKRERKPIFLSIGYSTCHWCHVMEKDSFELEEVATLMNSLFINIKVDREERPDVDDLYMSALHAMGQRGGWPLSMFLTPDLKPFFGGTYWPRAHFKEILKKLARLWRKEPEKIEEAGASLLSHLKSQKNFTPEGVPLDKSVFERFFDFSKMNFDVRWGGFGQAPKFPQATQLSTLLRIYRREQNPEALKMVELTLHQMARGGIYDHLSGGFARYSTDERWLVPHFEKMLYDNALLVKTYLEAYQLTHQLFYKSVAKEILDYVLDEMSHPEGGYYSAEDADSEGVEGKFCVWKLDEIQNLLTAEEARIFIRTYGPSSAGNFENGTNILFLTPDHTWDDKQNPLLISAHEKLLRARKSRIPPHKDDKILTAWNGLMLSAMALGYQALAEERYLESARKTAHFLKSALYSGKKLQARYREGESRFAACLDDFAFLIQGLIDLYESDFDPAILRWAIQLQHQQIESFWDSDQGGFFFTDGKDPSLLVRSKEGMDSALPNGNGVSALNLMRLHLFSPLENFRAYTIRIFDVFSKLMKNYPQASSQLILAYDFYSDSPSEIALIGKKTNPIFEDFLEGLRTSFHPSKAVALSEVPTDFPELLRGKIVSEGSGSIYLCREQRCLPPSSKASESLDLLLKGG